uniref:Uncharacterized protein n=1 Tax=Cacopsylla melanoneura TaxID=428564 RepID=A0A8D9BU86_9HEMI
MSKSTSISFGIRNMADTLRVNLFRIGIIWLCVRVGLRRIGINLFRIGVNLFRIRVILFCIRVYCGHGFSVLLAVAWFGVRIGQVGHLRWFCKRILVGFFLVLTRMIIISVRILSSG